MEKYIKDQMKELEDRTKTACDMRIETIYQSIDRMIRKSLVSFQFLCLKREKIASRSYTHTLVYDQKQDFYLTFFSNFRGMKEKKLTSISKNYR